MDLERLDLAQQHPAASPPARYTACAAADNATGQFLMYGGMGDGPVDLADTWNWTGTSWQQLTPATSPPGGQCEMTYDAARKVVVMLVNAPRTAPDAGALQTWIWNGSTWTQAPDVPVAAAGSGGPVPISFDSDTGTDLAYVGQTTCMQLGGSHSSQCVQTNQLWTFDGSAWTQAPAANNPQTGAGFAAAYDAATHQFVIIGGAINYTDGINAATLLYSAAGSATVTPSRLAGSTRQATAVAVCSRNFPPQAQRRPLCWRALTCSLTRWRAAHWLQPNTPRCCSRRPAHSTQSPRPRSPACYLPAAPSTSWAAPAHCRTP